MITFRGSGVSRKDSCLTCIRTNLRPAFLRFANTYSSAFLFPQIFVHAFLRLRISSSVQIFAPISSSPHFFRPRIYSYTYAFLRPRISSSAHFFVYVFLRKHISSSPQIFVRKSSSANLRPQIFVRKYIFVCNIFVCNYLPILKHGKIFF